MAGLAFSVIGRLEAGKYLTWPARACCHHWIFACPGFIGQLRHSRGNKQKHTVSNYRMDIWHFVCVFRNFTYPDALTYFIDFFHEYFVSYRAER